MTIASAPSPADVASARVPWMMRLYRWVCRVPLGLLGMTASIVIAVSSFGGGATRSRGGVLDALGLNFFAYGHGAAISNVVLLTGTVLFVFAWVRLGQQVMSETLPQQSAAYPLRRILVLWLWPWVFAAPIMSRDVYSYLMQGALLAKGFDPYTQGAAFNPGPYLVEVSPDWRNTTTPYGPAHLLIGKIITEIVGDNITAGLLLYKLVSFAGFLALAYAVPRIAAALGADPSFATWLGVANPLMVFHLIGGMHNESVMVGLTCLGILVALRATGSNAHRRPWQRGAMVLAGIAIIAVAISLKATAAFVLPFVIWYTVVGRSTTKAKIAAFFGYGIAGIVVTVAMVWAVTVVSGSNFGWIEALTGNTKVINPLAFPSFVTSSIGLVASVWTDSFPYNQLLEIVRKGSMIIMGLGMVGCWWYFRSSRLQATRGMIGAYVFAFVFNSVTLPWYYASILSLSGAARLGDWGNKLVTGVSIIVALAFTGGGNHQLYNIPWMVALIVFAWWAVQSIYHGVPGVRGEKDLSPHTIDRSISDH